MAAILVIGEYDAFREAMEFCLPKFGHTARAVPNVPAAIAWAAEHEVELVLFDVGRPRFAGVDGCEMLRRDRILGGVPVVVLSGEMTAEIVERALSAGAKRVLAKPFQWPLLLAAIASLVPGESHLSEW